MIGGFIEQQHVGAFEQQLRYLDAHAPSAAKLTCGPVEVGAIKAKSQERFLYLGLVVLGLVHGSEVVFMRKPVDKVLIVGAVIVGALGKFLIHLGNLTVELLDVVKSLHHLLFHSILVDQCHLLRQVTNRQVGRL